MVCQDPVVVYNIYKQVRFYENTTILSYLFAATCIPINHFLPHSFGFLKFYSAFGTVCNLFIFLSFFAHWSRG